jgi:D-ribose pyranase
MKKHGILHSELARIVAGMGHGDTLVICDSGYPIPHHRPVADVVLTRNIPRVIETLKVVLEELHVEGAIIANEMEKISPHMYDDVRKALGNVPIKKISHEKFKTHVATLPNTSFVRTGETTKYANIILIAGVTF